MSSILSRSWQIPKRHRTRCFTGCWTCRSRRVKCDEQRPGCRQCEQRGLVCQGYNVRVNLSNHHQPTTVSASASHVSQGPSPQPTRRLMGNAGANSTRKPRPRASSQTFAAVLQTLDESKEANSMVGDTLISVFPSRYVATARDPASNTTLASPNATARPLGPSGPQPDINILAPQPPCTPGDPCHASDSECSTEPTLALLGVNGAYRKWDTDSNDPETPEPWLRMRPHPSTSSHTQTSTAIATNIDLSHVMLAVPQPSATRVRVGISIKPTIPPQLDPLPIPMRQRGLIHHWVTTFSGNFPLVDGPDNPCRVLMLPIALAGLLSTIEQSRAGIAVFHAICALSAYNIYELNGRRRGEDYILGLKHEQLAITHVRHSLSRPSKYPDHSIGTAILACISIDAVSGTPRKWRAHISGGLAYLMQQQHGVPGLRADFGQHILQVAILCGWDIPTACLPVLDELDGSVASDMIFGTTGALIRAIARINSIYRSREKYTREALDSLELQLHLNMPTVRERDPGSIASLVIQHMSNAFYYATLLYFQRAVRRAPPESLQLLVQHGIHHLEEIELIRNGCSGGMVFWPILILGAECTRADLQTRVCEWFSRQIRLGFKNIQTLFEGIQLVWITRCRTGNSMLEWQSILLKERFDVFPI